MFQSGGHLKDRIESWLDDEGIPFENISDINSRFRIKAQMKNMEINVRESKVRVGCIVIEGLMALDQDQIELVKKSENGEHQRHALFLKFFRQLDRSEYLFQLSKDFLDPIWLRIQRILYSEDLTHSSLLGAMKDLDLKFVEINYELNTALDNMTEPSSDTKSSLYG